MVDLNYYIYRNHKDREDSNLEHYNSKILGWCSAQALIEIALAGFMIFLTKRDFSGDGDCTENDKAVNKLASTFYMLVFLKIVSVPLLYDLF